MRSFLDSLLQTILPCTCASCGDVLMPGEKQICINCLADLATTRYNGHNDNSTDRQHSVRKAKSKATSII